MKRELMAMILAGGAILGVNSVFGTTVNLATLSGDYTAKDGEMLTGTLDGNYKLSIADG